MEVLEQATREHEIRVGMTKETSKEAPAAVVHKLVLHQHPIDSLACRVKVLLLIDFRF